MTSHHPVGRYIHGSMKQNENRLNRSQSADNNPGPPLQPADPRWGQLPAGLLVLACLFLFISIFILIAILVFCRKRNTVFVLQKSEYEDDDDYDLDLESDYGFPNITAGDVESEYELSSFYDGISNKEPRGSSTSMTGSLRKVSLSRRGPFTALSGYFNAQRKTAPLPHSSSRSEFCEEHPPGRVTCVENPFVEVTEATSLDVEWNARQLLLPLHYSGEMELRNAYTRITSARRLPRRGPRRQRLVRVPSNRSALNKLRPESALSRSNSAYVFHNLGHVLGNPFTAAGNQSYEKLNPSIAGDQRSLAHRLYQYRSPFSAQCLSGVTETRDEAVTELTDEFTQRVLARPWNRQSKQNTNNMNLDIGRLTVSVKRDLSSRQILPQPPPEHSAETAVDSRDDSQVPFKSAVESS